MRVSPEGPLIRARLSRRWLIAAAIIVVVPLLAGLLVNQTGARAGVSLTVGSNTSIWDERPTHNVLHVFGEVSNAGPDPARQLQVTCTLYLGSAVSATATDPAEADILLPTENAPFDDLFFTWQPYDHYSCSVAGASTTSHADHSFTTTVSSVYTDSSNLQHITGTVVNNESVAVDQVNTILTFYGSSGTVMDELVVSINNGNLLGPGSGNAVSFDVTRTPDRPAWASTIGSVGTLTEAPAPAVAIAPTQVGFGPQVTGTESGTQFLAVTDVGTGGLTFPAGAVSVGGANPGDFIVAPDRCSGTTVAADGGSCTIGITFQPGDYGDRSALLTLADNADGTPQAVSLTGTGLSRAQIGASATSIDFGIQSAGTTVTRNLTISSTGLDAATIGVISLDNGSDFSIPGGTCLGSLAAGASCLLPVTFQPPAGVDSTYVGTLTITASDTGSHPARNSPLQVSLGGRGANGSASAQPTQLAFGSIAVGASSQAQLVTLSSNGAGPLQISQIQASPADFSQTNNCPTSLPSGQSCSISVTFTPGSAGAKSGGIVVTDNDPGGPASVTLTGTGTVPPTSFYFAEGFTGSGFHEVLSMLTPKQTGTAAIDYYTNVGHLGPYSVALTAGRVALEDVNARMTQVAPAGFNNEVSARVTLSVPGVVERTINFNNGSWHGSTDQVGAPHPASEWEFAEGSTYSAYSEYLTLQNPNATQVAVTLNYFTDSGQHPVKHVILGANSRSTVLVYSGLPIDDGACLTGAAGNCGVGPGIGGVSVQVLSTGGPIVAERPFYVNSFNFGSGTIRDGHDAFGAYAPSSDWYFAEGSTLAGFNEYLTLENPNSNDTIARLNYVDDRHRATLKSVPIPMNSRVTVAVFGTALGVGPGITGVSVHVNSDLPIVAERPMYMVENFGSGVVAGAHDAVGATGLGTLFGFAAASTIAGDTDFLTLQNPGGTDATASISYYYGGSGQVPANVTVPANTRVTVRVGDFVPAGQYPIGIVISSSKPILVEKPTYSSNSATYGATDAVGYSPSGF